MRELPFEHPAAQVAFRITPACAGITSSVIPSSAPARDHPRVCGNYTYWYASESLKLGSPPRVRELLFVRTSSSSAHGITPACAGITGRNQGKRGSSRDHPRVCGNYARNIGRHTRRLGSPPRVRELPKISTSRTRTTRITPACAGITRRN